MAEYGGQGFRVTLGQLYYQVVARDLLENKQTECKRLGEIIKDGRRAGQIDWDAIEDRTREVHTHASWDDPADIITNAARQYREDPWRDQIWRPEVWIEKDALLGVIEGVCREWRGPHFASPGNNSETPQCQAGKRFARDLDAGLTPIALHQGEHTTHR